jgi:hypothetical protein
VVRGSAGGVPHRIEADPDSGRCVRDCNPVLENLRGRAFEISCSEDCPTDERGRPYVGRADPEIDFACVVDDATDGIDPGEPGSECVFQSLTTRFAIYRGLEESTRDMRFRWQLGEGFNPLSRSLSSSETTPRSVTFIPHYGQLAFTDGTVRGLTFLSPRNVSGQISTVF